MIYYLDIVGTFAFAVSGTLAAADRKMDIFGALFLAAVTAIGGGTVRDLLLDAHPIVWTVDYNYLWVITLAVIFTILFQKWVFRLRKTLFFFDTVGIGVFTIIGLEKALSYDVFFGAAVILGIFSAVLGGIIRDTLCGESPLIFKKEIYATPCLLGGLLYASMRHYGIENPYLTYISVLFIMSIRFLAVRYHLALPQLSNEGLEKNEHSGKKSSDN
ncbi:trimeric intracellular cation channel family protein [Sediminitomix flava]|uniref:Putative membrane protein YeiH n=1 Tax=Sediminitomix flava TaxID=379075 RepID=A0A315ZHU1_SEDFL|nr:trimeric intracellular cation channel family protein [Sediminitomix flava]PWJ44284.1 putative membrane protein YeiH [Sediminitomix flava]